MSSNVFVVTLCIILAACNLPGGQSTTRPQAWFDMPLPETVLYSPNPCQVIAHGASSKGIASFELSINGTVIGTIINPDPENTLATLTHECAPLRQGENLIEMRVQDRAGVWSDSARTNVFLAEPVSNPAIPTPRATDKPVSTLTANPTPTATLLPSLTPTLVPTITSTLTLTPLLAGLVAIERISSDLVYLGRAGCDPLEVTITARATAPNGITAVVLFYRFQTGNASTEFQSLSMGFIGGDLYRVTLNPTSMLGGSIPFNQATLQYQIVVQQNDGDVSIRTPVLADISLQACGNVTTSCSSFSDERTCIANGCSWSSVPGIVPLYECRIP